MAHLFVNSRFALAGIELSLAKAWMFSVKVRQDKTRQDNFITFLQKTLLTDLVPQVAKASRGGPGTIK